MGILGHKVFVPLDEISDDASAEDVVRLYLKERGADATGLLTSEGIIVCKGSRIKASPVPSCPDFVKTLREANSSYIGADFVLTKDIPFNSPSAAAGFCVFGSANGRVAWKDESGKTLKERDAEV